jgi:colanic acid biosynthesis protein WcaH
MQIEDGLYKRIISCLPIACVDVSIVHDGRVLLVRRGDKPALGEWWLPGGRVHKGERMIDTARRKALEEVGMDCFVGPLVHTAETIFPDGPYDESVHSINSCFILYPRYGCTDVMLDKHHEDYRWVTKIDANFAPYVKDCLKKCGLEM